MGTLAHLPGAMPPMPAVARILARYDRDKLEAFISVAIDLSDTLDGPHDADAPDFRPCSDGQPGDPGDTEHAGDEVDMAWSDRVSQERAGPCMGTEDDEDDDPSGQCDEDGVNTGNRVPYQYGGFDHSGPGCPISDTGEHDWRVLRRLKADEDYGGMEGV